MGCRYKIEIIHFKVLIITIHKRMASVTESERKFLDEFVESNPFPSYDEIVDLLNRQLDEGDLYAIYLIAEFGQLNYEMMKLMYANTKNTNIINDCIRTIIKNRGQYALIMNLYTMSLVSGYLYTKSK